MAAILVVGWAVGMAARSVEPWGDSPRAVYALVAVVLLLVALLPLGLAVSELRYAARWHLVVARWEWVVILGGSALAAVPVLKSATNSFAASSIGEGGPSVLLDLLGAVGLSLVLATLMTKRLYVGVLAAAALASVLLAGTVIFAR
ncbi:MAG: hypothetical protein M3071_07415 [Actinomycetota bacterium]|nr:hypothetical protein [Actinomycetota bacterium]